MGLTIQHYDLLIDAIYIYIYHKEIGSCPSLDFNFLEPKVDIYITSCLRKNYI